LQAWRACIAGSSVSPGKWRWPGQFPQNTAYRTYKNYARAILPYLFAATSIFNTGRSATPLTTTGFSVVCADKSACAQGTRKYILIQLKPEFKAQLVEFFGGEVLVEMLKEILFVD
jgi:hypothetical protein